MLQGPVENYKQRMAFENSKVGRYAQGLGYDVDGQEKATSRTLSCVHKYIALSGRMGYYLFFSLPGVLPRAICIKGFQPLAAYALQ